MARELATILTACGVTAPSSAGRTRRLPGRSVARVAHGYPKVVRGWSFSSKLKGNCLPRDERDSDPKAPSSSVLPGNEENKHEESGCGQTKLRRRRDRQVVRG